MVYYIYLLSLNSVWFCSVFTDFIILPSFLKFPTFYLFLKHALSHSSRLDLCFSLRAPLLPLWFWRILVSHVEFVVLFSELLSHPFHLASLVLHGNFLSLKLFIRIVEECCFILDISTFFFFFFRSSTVC